MLDVHYWTTPNGHKITIFLEEAGLPYNIIPVNIGKGEQFKAEFLAVSPNNRIPAGRHAQPDGSKPLRCSVGAILPISLTDRQVHMRCSRPHRTISGRSSG
jgi:GST-like protein